MAAAAQRVLADNARKAQKANAVQLELGLVRVWERMGPSEAAEAAYAQAAAEAIGAGQRRAWSLSAAYVDLAAELEGVAGAMAPEAPFPEGLAVRPETPWVRAPVLRLRAALAEGDDIETARARAGGYAVQLARRDLVAAEQAGADAQAAESGMAGARWQKELDPDACEWCELVGAERTYTSAESVPAHAGDRCGVSLVFD